MLAARGRSTGFVCAAAMRLRHSLPTKSARDREPRFIPARRNRPSAAARRRARRAHLGRAAAKGRRLARRRPRQRPARQGHAPQHHSERTRLRVFVGEPRARSYKTAPHSARAPSTLSAASAAKPATPIVGSGALASGNATSKPAPPKPSARTSLKSATATRSQKLSANLPFPRKQRRRPRKQDLRPGLTG